MTQADPKSDVVDLGRADDTNALKPRASRRVRRTDGKYRLAVDLLLDDEASYAAARTLLYVIKAGGNPERLVDAVRTALGRNLDPAVDRLLRRLLQELAEAVIKPAPTHEGYSAGQSTPVVTKPPITKPGSKPPLPPPFAC